MKNIKKSFKKLELNSFTIIFFIALTLYTLVMIFMFGWTLMTTMKGFDEFIDYPLNFPKHISWDNYKYVWDNLYYINPTTREKIYVEGMFGNSLFYALGCATVNVIVCSVTAYATSMFKYKFSDVVYGIVIICMALPIVGNLPSEIRIVTGIGLDGSILGMFVLKANFLGMYYMIFHAMFSAIPQSYAEAAKIDGAGNFTIMLKIYYPLCFNVLFTVWLLYFITYWNDYQTLLLYCAENPTIALGLWLFKGKQENTVPHRMAAAMLVFIPIFTVFLVFRKRIMSQISMDGGVKG